MLYVDSCIPMYLVGAAHRHKRRVIELVPQLLHAHEELVTSAETFQEIIHRYKAAGDLSHLQIAYEALEEITPRVEAIAKPDTDMARTFAARYPRLSSRDCLHAAVMKRMGCARIWTYDAGFDTIPSLTRIE